MDFFIKHINTLINPVLFISGNLLYSYATNKYLRPIKIPERIVDVTKEYIDKSKHKFIKTFNKDNTDMNTNIDKEFYIVEDYTTIMKDINNNLEDKWKIKTVCEYTPKGNIIMYYDPYKQGFAYYADEHPISYDILNSVAMRYVTTFKCRDFFVDDQVTPESEVSPFIKIHMTDKSKKKETDSSNSIKNSEGPFAKLKRNNNKLISQPIKGTSRRDIDFVIDKKLKDNLSLDPKERSENIMIVDLVRNDMSRFSKPGSVKVKELCEVYPFKQVHQMISTIESKVDSSLKLVK